GDQVTILGRGRVTMSEQVEPLSDSGPLGGTVKNNSSKKLVVAFGDGKTWLHRILEPNTSTGYWEDADGFRVGEPGNQTIKNKDTGASHDAWWKISDMQTAVVRNGEGGALEFEVIYRSVLARLKPPQKKSDDDFGWQPKS